MWERKREEEKEEETKNKKAELKIERNIQTQMKSSEKKIRHRSQRHCSVVIGPTLTHPISWEREIPIRSLLSPSLLLSPFPPPFSFKCSFNFLSLHSSIGFSDSSLFILFPRFFFPSPLFPFFLPLSFPFLPLCYKRSTWHRGWSTDDVSDSRSKSCSAACRMGGAKVGQGDQEKTEIR